MSGKHRFTIVWGLYSNGGGRQTVAKVLIPCDECLEEKDMLVTK